MIYKVKAVGLYLIQEFQLNISGENYYDQQKFSLKSTEITLIWMLTNCFGAEKKQEILLFVAIVVMLVLFVCRK